MFVFLGYLFSQKLWYDCLTNNVANNLENHNNSSLREFGIKRILLCQLPRGG